MTISAQAKALADRIRSASRAAALSGAGMSVESGLPTFRSGSRALWRNHDPMTLATPDAFARDPVLVWEWYRERLRAHGSAQPNPGHLALAELERRIATFTLITQNVDGLHLRAGSRDVIELHGDVRTSRCIRCGERVETPLAGEVPPRCACGGLLRPNVVWFGEALPAGAYERAYEAVAQSHVFIVAGTSAIVFPAAGLVEVARAAGAFVVEVNPDETPATSRCDVSVRAPSGEFLPLVVQHL
ncbi:MAG: NAD-dependent deacylase [Candidatus Eremiobacteraeota bacterium]|nr:NAD-dependent deacylase [Candidatus Eremiobacteraeota bacterium]MBV8367301.1 NAD-dependent deacylase [Candidatus Eremiobacteraeota bacterium]